MNTTTGSSKYILDEDVPKINTPLLKPTNYLKNAKQSYFAEKSKEKVKLFDKNNKILKEFDKYHPSNNKSYKKVKNWYNNLKENVIGIFNKIQGKVAPTAKFKLVKEALNVTKKYEMDLKKFELSLYDPISLLNKVKPLILTKFKSNPSTKQQITIECLMKKTNPATGEETVDKAHFHSYYEEIFDGSNFDEIYGKNETKSYFEF